MKQQPSNSNHTLANPARIHQSIGDNFKPDILTLDQRNIFVIINYVVICTCVCFMGIVANIINIIVFIKQGFKNTVNICFLGLAISDFCCLVSLQWIAVCFNPYFADAGAPWVAEEFQYLTAAWPHIISGRITSYITVYVTGERCMCILFPMKVKQMITPLRTTMIVVLIYLLNILTMIPEYLTAYLEWKFFPATNRTLISLSFTSNREDMFGIVFFLSFVTGVTSFVAVILFTSILVIKLKETSQWRKSVGDQSLQMSNRDKKTVKLIILIACMLIVCFTPSAVVSLVTFVEPEFDLRKQYVNTVISMWSISCIFQAINSSANIFLYYGMSSKYKVTFDELFARCHNSNTYLRKT